MDERPIGDVASSQNSAAFVVEGTNRGILRKSSTEGCVIVIDDDGAVHGLLKSSFEIEGFPFVPMPAAPNC